MHQTKTTAPATVALLGLVLLCSIPLAGDQLEVRVPLQLADLDGGVGEVRTSCRLCQGACGATSVLGEGRDLLSLHDAKTNQVKVTRPVPITALGKADLRGATDYLCSFELRHRSSPPGSFLPPLSFSAAAKSGDHWRMSAPGSFLTSSVRGTLQGGVTSSGVALYAGLKMTGFVPPAECTVGAGAAKAVAQSNGWSFACRLTSNGSFGETTSNPSPNLHCQASKSKGMGSWTLSAEFFGGKSLANGWQLVSFQTSGSATPGAGGSHLVSFSRTFSAPSASSSQSSTSVDIGLTSLILAKPAGDCSRVLAEAF